MKKFKRILMFIPYVAKGIKNLTIDYLKYYPAYDEYLNSYKSESQLLDETFNQYDETRKENLIDILSGIYDDELLTFEEFKQKYIILSKYINIDECRQIIDRVDKIYSEHIPISKRYQPMCEEFHEYMKQSKRDYSLSENPVDFGFIDKKEYKKYISYDFIGIGNVLDIINDAAKNGFFAIYPHLNFILLKNDNGDDAILRYGVNKEGEIGWVKIDCSNINDVTDEYYEIDSDKIKYVNNGNCKR